MHMYDLITKKKHGAALTDEEIAFMIEGYVKGEIPDYQMSAMLMAIWFSGMTDRETAVLTQVMARSGDQIDLSAISGRTVDKHSTGGVGDKTTLIACPIVAACGGKIAKMSGRGLGHTGGTVDKLASIPGYRTELTREEFFHTVETCGISLIGQSGNLAPADKKLYALRDVTATVDSIPLIASSIMSKKLAAGASAILLDVKTGSGAFMKTQEDAIRLAQTMVAIGEAAGRRTVALITDMDVPLGCGIGNSIEVRESAAVLRGEGPADLREVSLSLAANMLFLIGKGTPAACRAMAEHAIADGSALATLCRMVRAGRRCARPDGGGGLRGGSVLARGLRAARGVRHAHGRGGHRRGVRRARRGPRDEGERHRPRRGTHPASEIRRCGAGGRAARDALHLAAGDARGGGAALRRCHHDRRGAARAAPAHLRARHAGGRRALWR